MESDQIDLEYENIKKFENIDVSLKVHAGAAGITIGNLLKLQVGSVIELDTLAGEHLKIYVNGVPIARGEIVIMGTTLGVRFTSIMEIEK
mgnify:CR=1 FL=1